MSNFMNQYALFENLPVKAPLTQGIKYAGSKQKLLPYIPQLINKVSPKVVLDGFAGTTRVSQALAQSGYRVISNDISVWSEVFGNCYLMNKQPASYYIPVLKHLNQLQPIDGWYTEHYGGEIQINGEPAHSGLKHPWQKHNTRKLDAIGDEIAEMNLPYEEECVLLTSLILALDQEDRFIRQVSALAF